MSGVELIAAERQRHIDGEGWSSEHDDSHRAEQLAYAAACYAIPPRLREAWGSFFIDTLWPWRGRSNWWKPTASVAHRGFAYEHDGDRVRELVKAGALIAAEIDRLQRRPVREGTP